jgi:hypothetical protein
MLLEFNRKLADGVHKIEEGHIQNVVRLAEAGATANPLDIRVLKQLLEWPFGRCEIYLHVGKWYNYKQNWNLWHHKVTCLKHWRMS